VRRCSSWTGSFSELFNKLAFDDDQSDRGDVTARRGDLAFSLVFGW
jgi:hypothetical protein